MSTNGSYQKRVTSNGLRIITERMPEVSSVAVSIWIDSGSADEIDDARGLSHFAEHILFKGTKRRTAADIAREMDAIGGYLNGWTEREHTCYYVKVLSPYAEDAVDILCDMVSHPALRPEDIEIERNVILEEIKSYEDSPEDWVNDLFTETIWRGNPLGRNLMGTVETVSCFNQRMIRSFLREHYLPNNMIVAAVGDLHHDQFAGWVTRRLGRLRGKRTTVQKNGKPRVKANVTMVSKNTEQVYLAVGTHGYSQGARDKFAAFLLESILGGGSSSRLFQEIREKRGLVYGISSFCACYRSAGYFVINAGANLGNIERVTRLIERELRKIKTNGITEAELRRAKEQMKSNLLFSMESNSSRMWMNARAEMYFGRKVGIEESIEQIERTTRDDVVRVANELFDDRYINVAAVGPFDQKRVNLEISVG